LLNGLRNNPTKISVLDTALSHIPLNEIHVYLVIAARHSASKSHPCANHEGIQKKKGL